MRELGEFWARDHRAGRNARTLLPVDSDRRGAPDILRLGGGKALSSKVGPTILRAIKDVLSQHGQDVTGERLIAPVKRDGTVQEDGVSAASDESLPVRVSGPEPALRTPKKLLGEIASNLRASPPLAWQLFVRDLRATYRQSLLGYLWLFLPPLAWAAMFILLRRQDVVRTGMAEADYAAFVITGMVAWHVFVDALNAPLRHFGQARPLLGKIRFPQEALVLAGLAEVGFQALARAPLLAWACWLATPGADPAIGRFLLALFGLAILGTALGVLMLPLGLLYQDVARGLALVTSFWLLLTPVGYQASGAGVTGAIARWNPVSPLIEVSRSGWLGLETQSVAAALCVGTLSLLVLGASWVVFRIAFPHIVARMGA